MKPIKRRNGTIKPTFACLPRTLLLHPPISHRHTLASERFLTPFEFLVMTGCLVAARATVSADHHRHAFGTGADMILNEKALAQVFKDDWAATKKERKSEQGLPAPQRHHTFRGPVYRPMSLPKTLKRAGRKGYEDAREKLRTQPLPETITVEVSRNKLLRYAGRPDGGREHRRLQAALNRLRYPVGREKGIPVLGRWEELASGRLRLEVAGAWLQPPFVRVPIPLPAKSPSVLALYLFLQGIDTRSDSRKVIGLGALYGRIGIATRWGGFNAQRTFDNALAAVNDYLENLDDVEVPFQVPAGYRMTASHGSRTIRFTAISRKDEDNKAIADPTPDEAIRPRRKKSMERANKPLERVALKPLFERQRTQRAAVRIKLRLRSKPERHIEQGNLERALEEPIMQRKRSLERVELSNAARAKRSVPLFDEDGNLLAS